MQTQSEKACGHGEPVPGLIKVRSRRCRPGRPGRRGGGPRRCTDVYSTQTTRRRSSHALPGIRPGCYGERAEHARFPGGNHRRTVSAETPQGHPDAMIPKGKSSRNSSHVFSRKHPVGARMSISANVSRSDQRVLTEPAATLGGCPGWPSETALEGPGAPCRCRTRLEAAEMGPESIHVRWRGLSRARKHPRYICCKFM
jgi:hypothetical protein